MLALYVLPANCLQGFPIAEHTRCVKFSSIEMENSINERVPHETHYFINRVDRFTTDAATVNMAVLSNCDLCSMQPVSLLFTLLFRLLSVLQMKCRSV
jgi:hypothetical protein